MKKIILFFLSLLLTFPAQAVSQNPASEETDIAPSVQTQSAEQTETENDVSPALSDASVPTEEETTANLSAPKLMVTAYKLQKPYILPGKSSRLSVTLHNTNEQRDVRNLKLTLTDQTQQIIPQGMGTAYIACIRAGESYVWETELSAVHIADEGRHALTLCTEYEDEAFASYASSDTLYVDIKQPVSLDFDGAVLPKKVVQGDTVSISINLMNTGKSTLSNVRVVSQIEKLTTGGSVFVGDIPAGESKTAGINYLVSSESTGNASGHISIRYEDIYGKSYTVKQPVSTLVEKKVELTELEAQDEKPRIKWWIILLGGAVTGIPLGAAIPAAVYASRKRKEDEKRL